MPNNWKTYSVEELINEEIIYKPLDGNHGGTHPKGSDFIKSGIPFIMATDIVNGKVDITNCKFISKEQADKLRKGFAKTGDILITHKASIGRTAVVPEIESEYIMLTPQVTYYRVRDRKKLDVNYLKHYFNSPFFQNEINTRAGSGSTRAYLGITDQLKLTVTFPLLQEQQAIASILSAINDKIENNLAINKTLEEMAMALYKYWFVDFGPFQDGEFVESKLGMIPKGWEVKIVKDFGDVVTGKTPEKKYPEHFGDVIPFITPTDFKDYGKHIVSANRYISELGIKKLNKNILPINTVIVTCIGSDMGKVALSKIDSLTNQQINSLKTNHYLYMYCFFINNYTLLKRMAGDGTTMPIINKSSFENIKVIYPSKMVLNNFEKLINDYDEQILSNTLENQTLTQLRDTLLPQLISGAVRLKEFRETVEEVV